MIVINAEFYILPEQKKQFLNEISELIQASRKEEGCLYGDPVGKGGRQLRDHGSASG